MEFDFFMRQLVAGKNIDETCFYFIDDKDKEEHYLGFCPRYDKPYWIGYCDIKYGAEFESAEELVNAPVFDKRTLKERWNDVRIISIEGCCLEDWIKYCRHA
ncbi:MAG: hypothetical protein ACI4SS_03675 [Clostridia bacterium]